MKRVRRMAAVIAAVGLSLLMTGEAMAVSWSPKVALTSSRSADAAALVTLGSNHAAAVIENSGKIFVRRSADSGATWKSALRLDTAYSLFAAIGGYGTDVDVVWTKSSNYDQDSALKYMRSTNYGRTFTSAVTLASLSDPSSSGIYARVAHGPG
jgi:hypothetical protein